MTAIFYFLVPTVPKPESALEPMAHIFFPYILGPRFFHQKKRGSTRVQWCKERWRERRKAPAYKRNQTKTVSLLLSSPQNYHNHPPLMYVRIQQPAVFRQHTHKHKERRKNSVRPSGPARSLQHTPQRPLPIYTLLQYYYMLCV